MEDNVKIYFVSLGTGNPLEITLKALKILEGVDRIYCPNIKRINRKIQTMSYDTLRALSVPPDKILPFEITCSEKSEEIDEQLKKVVCDMKFHVGQGEKVAVAMLEDSYMYELRPAMLKSLDCLNEHVGQVAGVPVYMSAVSSAGIQILKEKRRMLVIPGEILVEELLESVIAKRTLVILDALLGEAILRPFMARHSELLYYYFEAWGSADEFFSSSRNEILERPFAKSSVLIIYH